jgi:hypothetical protein
MYIALSKIVDFTFQNLKRISSYGFNGLICGCSLGREVYNYLVICYEMGTEYWRNATDRGRVHPNPPNIPHGLFCNRTRFSAVVGLGDQVRQSRHGRIIFVTAVVVVTRVWVNFKLVFIMLPSKYFQRNFGSQSKYRWPFSCLLT